MTALGVAIGGALGAFARYSLEGVIAQRQRTPFPLSTLIINVSGSVLLGAIVGAVLSGSLPKSTLTWAGTGFCGGYTTFSTLTYETVRLIEDSAWRYCAWNIALSGPLSFLGAGATYLLLK
ncbi:MAG: CrcB family protein [Actinomycetota bacterium]